MNPALFVEATFQFGMLFLIQSTLLIGCSYLIVRLLRLRGAALLSVIYRSVLVAILIDPVATSIALQCDLNGWRPRVWMERPDVREKSSPETRIAADESAAIPDTSMSVAPSMAESPIGSGSREPLQVASFPDPSRFWNRTKNAFQGMPILSFVFVGKTILCLSWFSISLAMLTRYWRTRRRLWRTLMKAVPAEASVQLLCDSLAKNLGISSPRVVCSPFFSIPFLAGVQQPVIHLTSDDDQALVDDRHAALRDVLVHELAHHKRRDVFIRMLSRITLSIFFFQPLLWRLVKWIENSAEDVCDDYAMSFGARRDRYAVRLVDFAERCHFQLSEAVGMTSRTSMLSHRVTRIMDSSRQLSTQVNRRLLAVLCAIKFLAVLSVCLLMIPSSDGNPINSGSQDTLSSVLPASSDDRATDGTFPAVASWPQDIVRGTIHSSQGPVSGAEVFWWRSRVHDMEPMKPIRVVTDAKGRFEIMRTPPNPNDAANWDMREEMAIRANGYAFERTDPTKFGAKIPSNPDDPRQHPASGEPLMLATSGKSITGRLIDLDGKPIANARIRMRWFSQQRNRESLTSAVTGVFAALTGNAPKARNEAEWIEEVFSLVHAIEHVPLRDALPSSTTNIDGNFQLIGLPSDTLFELLVEGKGIQSTNLVVRNYDGQKILTVPQKEGYTHDPPTKVYPANFEAVIGPSVTLVGSVTDQETGEPISGAIVRANMVAGEKIMSSRERQHLAVRTDSAGRYRLEGLPIGEENNLVVFSLGETPYTPIQSEAKTSDPEVVRAGERVINFQLKKGIWAEGRVYDADTGQSFQGEITYYWFRNRELESKYKGNLLAYLDGRYFTDSLGRYRIPVLPTAGVIAFSTGNRDHKRMAAYPRGYGEDELTGYRQPDSSYPLYSTAPTYLMPGNYNRLALVEPKPGETRVTVDMRMAASKPIPVTILNPDGTLATEPLEIYGGSERWGWQDKSPQSFVVEDLLKGQSRKVFAFDRKRNLVGGTIVDHTGRTFEIKLASAGRIHGRLLDSDGQPFSNVSLVPDGQFDNEHNGVWAQEKGKQGNQLRLTIDAQGRFQVIGLSQKWTYSAWVDQQKEGMGGILIGHAFRELWIEPGEDRDLGDVRLIKP